MIFNGVVMFAIPPVHRRRHSTTGPLVHLGILVGLIGLFLSSAYSTNAYATTPDASGVIILELDVDVAEVVLDGRIVKLDLTVPTKRVTIPHVDRNYSHWLEVSGRDVSLPTKTVKIRPGDFQLKRRKDGREVYVAKTTVVFQSGKTNAGVMQYVRDGGAVITSVLIILVALSVLSWLLIVAKVRQIGRAKSQTDSFLTAFNQARTFTDARASAESYQQSPAVSMYHAARSEMEKRSRSGGPLDDHVVENAQRAMERAGRESIHQLEHRLSFLGTVASAAPFIGLFGTVWGIMEAFGSIQPGHETLDAVAPHLANALIATAVGLLAAIPAVMAYNMFIGKIRGISIQLDGFADEMNNRLVRASSGLKTDSQPVEVSDILRAENGEVP